ncbi:DUF5686 family protein [Mucilaginibacter sp. McL0603]|uniref:DUF5686 family protein n=1 Tax=Mucilaginibacter sp. McL0603 TaxID=3415670 RepID=UPI003CEEAA93
MRRYLLLLFIVIISVHTLAQQQLLTGRVTDHDNKPISFAAVYIRNSTYGTIANEAGRYQFKLAPGNYDVVYRFAGYQEKVENITITDQGTEHNVKLVDEAYDVKQFGKDSAINIVRKVIGKREYYLKQVKKYSSIVYIKGVQKLDHAPKSLMGQDVADALSVDSSGKGILYQSESLSNYNFLQPDKIKEEMIASRSTGQNTAFSYNKASDLEVNFYRNIFSINGLSSHGFISPIAPKALRFYKYNLVGSKIENGLKIYKIQVIPKRKYNPVFTGYIYIVDGDWRLYSVDLMLTNKNNGLNLIDTLKVSQAYIPITDSVWLPLAAQYSFRGTVLGFTFEGYYLSIHNNYILNPAFADNYFNGERMRVDTVENSRDSVFWNRVRPVPLTRQEMLDNNKKEFRAQLEKAIQKYDPASIHKNRFLVLPYIPFGYKASYNNNKDSIYVFPFIQTLFYNTVEGMGINLKGTYTHYYDDFRSYSITPNLRYGFASKLFNANVRGDYTFDPNHRGAFTGGFGSDILDLNNVGTRSLYFNTLSTLLSERNFVKYYRSQFVEFGYQHDIITNGLLLKANLSYANRTQLYNNSYYTISTFEDRHLTSNNPLMPDAPADDRSVLFPQNQALTLAASLTYTIDQQYETRPTGRVYDLSPYPQIRLSYRKGINGLGSDVDYDFASIEVYQEHLNTGITGFSSFKFAAGDFFNRNQLYFMDYYHFSGNQGTTFDPTPGSFHFLPFYTYSASGAFLEAHYEHNFTGYFLSDIPLIRKLKLDEIIGVNYLTENNNRNYSEFYIGLQRLIFRVDYGISFAGNHKYMQGFKIFYGIK